MKNHRIIQLGLILPDNTDLKDYQINILNSLKKNKFFKIRIFKINCKKINNLTKNLFFLEKKFSKKKKFISNEISKFLKNSRKTTYNELKSYSKKDVNIFINLSGTNISNQLIGINKPLWEIVYGKENSQTFPICFNDIVDKKPFSIIKIIELFNDNFRLINKGFFNTKSYAILHQEFMFEKTAVLLFKSLNLIRKNNLSIKKTKKTIIKNKNISLFKLFKYFFENYFFNLIDRKKDINWRIFASSKKELFNLKYLKKKNSYKKFTNGYFADPFIYKFKKV